jgi:hypothetical protein
MVNTSDDVTSLILENIHKQYNESKLKSIVLNSSESNYYLGNKYIKDKINLLRDTVKCNIHVAIFHCDKLNCENKTNCIDELHLLNPCCKWKLNLKITNRQLNNIKYNKVNDVGHLKKLKVLTIDKYVEGIHLLSNLDELKITSNVNEKKINARIKKLRQLNPNIKVTIMHTFV